jgi:DNA-binding NtrC family response regulator
VMSDILLVDDDVELLQSVMRILQHKLDGRKIIGVSSSEKALEVISKDRPLVAIVDLCLDESVGIDSGFSLIERCRSLDGDLRILVLTGHGSVANGVRAMTLGASSFLEKPVDPDHLAALVRDALNQGELRREYYRLKEHRDTDLTKALCGSSDAIKKLREDILFAAATSLPVLILGETGTGKSLSARLIHEHGKRCSAKFVHYHPNFAGGDIVQSELFGHRKGAFTGAVESRRGLVIEADKGTLFIDELDAVPSDTQVLLLDLLQERRVRPVGADSFSTVDCRFIAATNKPIDEALSSQTLRQDLYHRMAHCVIELPPLRSRKEDIDELVRAALSQVQKQESLNVFECSPDALELLQQYDWPGNVRELVGVVQVSAHRAQFRGRSFISSEDLTIRMSEHSKGDETPARQGDFHAQVESFKRKLIAEALVDSRGNQVQAAQALGIDRGTIRRLSIDS